MTTRLSEAVATGDIVAALGGELLGDPGTPIDRIGPLEEATATTIGFVSNPRYRAQLAASAAGCVIVAPALRDEAVARGTTILVPDPYLYFARLTQWWAARVRPRPPAGMHPSAVVDPAARVAAGASIGPLAVIEADAEIGEGAIVGAQCFVGRGARVGAQTLLHPRVTLAFGCSIGARGIVHSGAVIGADGFGLAPTPQGYVKIEQLGAVRIGDDVEIGANTCIDRGALEDTVIEDGVKLDNLIQIAHNCRIGRHTAMAGCSAIAGSTHVGERVTIGGQAGLGGHLRIGDDVHIAAKSTVTRSLTKPGIYGGHFPLDENGVWEKNAALVRQLPAWRERLRALERGVREGGAPRPEAGNAPADGPTDE